MFIKRVIQYFNSKNTNYLHRWNVFVDNKYLNCFEKLERCNNINYEDYSLCNKKGIKKTTFIYKKKNNSNFESKLFLDNDFVYYHF